ncbi:MAG: hypothetical protein AYK23_03425 [Candidatus Proteinoplasmatales archaeon SG8-5]|nr:MAG: hypothetical protein AYK23_03425 [Candidatus Proteinoplasmatales archaeon SG8-5]
MSALPSRGECLALLREAGCSPEVIEHCLAVEAFAVGIAERCPKDTATVELVSRGALLHDIGRGVTHGIGHAVEGSDLIREKGLDERLALIVERHIGAGLSPEEAVAQGLPPRSYMPVTLEEKIIAHSDNLVGEREHAAIRMPLAEAVEKARARGLDALAERMTELHYELSQMCGVNLDEIE